MPASVRSYTVGTGTGSSISVARPSGVAAGDQLWAFHSCDDETLVGMTAPSGWVSAASLNTDNVLPTRVWRKVASGGEPSTYAFGQPGNVGGAVHIIAIRDASASIAARGATLTSFGTSTPTPTVTPAAASHLEIRYAAVSTILGATTWTAPSGYTMRGIAQVDGVLGSASATRQIASSAPSGVKTFLRTPNTISVAGAGITVSIASADLEPELPPIPPFTPGAGSALYQYPFRRMVGDRAYLGHLDLSGVSFERRDSSPGTFTARVPITSTKIGDQIDAIIPRDPAALTRGPGVICCEMLRAGDYWGEAWITGYAIRKSRRQVPVLELRGTTLEGYLQHVLLRENLEFTGVDQIEIARALLESMAAVPGADIDLILQSGTSGEPRDRHYKADDNGTYGQRLAELGEVLDGFEWTIDSRAGSGGLERHWRWGAPTLGDADAEHVFGSGSYGGDVLDWAIEVDALKGGTHWQARGDTIDDDASTEATPLLSGIYESAPHTAAGWPRIDRLVDRAGVTVQQTLEDYAAGWAARKSGAVRVFSVTVAIGKVPTFTPNDLGNPARFVLSDEWHKRVGLGAGLNARHRIIGCRVVPVGRENGKDEMQLIVEEQEVT